MVTNIWLKNYLHAKKYYEEHENLLVPRHYYITYDNKEIDLGEWIADQRKQYNKGILDSDKVILLNDINMTWKIKGNIDVISDSWYKKYSYAKKYYEEHGNLLIPKWYYITVNGKNVNLGDWIARQRELMRSNKLGTKKIELLNDIEMEWELKNNDEYISNSWSRKYELAEKYYEEHGNLLIPAIYTLYTDDGKKIPLGSFIRCQRILKEENKLSKKKIELLDKIGMAWKVQKNINIIKDSWMEKYELAKKYYEKYGNLLVPAKYTEYYISKEIPLGWWIREQRKNYKNNNLGIEKIRLLNEIEMVWNIKENNVDWNRHYLILEEYKNLYGDLFIPENYIYKDKDEEINLHNWLNDQRSILPGKKGLQSITRYNLLNELNISWERKITLDSLAEYIKNEYDSYVLGTLSSEEVSKLVSSGAFKYTDNNEVEMSDEKDFAKKISLRSK